MGVKEDEKKRRKRSRGMRMIKEGERLDYKEIGKKGKERKGRDEKEG